MKTNTKRLLLASLAAAAATPSSGSGPDGARDAFGHALQTAKAGAETRLSSHDVSLRRTESRADAPDPERTPADRGEAGAREPVAPPNAAGVSAEAAAVPMSPSAAGWISLAALVGVMCWRRRKDRKA